MKKYGQLIKIVIFPMLLLYSSTSCTDDGSPSKQEVEQLQRRAAETAAARIAREEEIRARQEGEAEYNTYLSSIDNMQPRSLSTEFKLPTALRPIQNTLPLNIYRLNLRFDMYYNGSWKTPGEVRWSDYVERHRSDCKAAGVLQIISQSPSRYLCSQLKADDDPIDLSLLRECPVTTKTVEYYLHIDRREPPMIDPYSVENEPPLPNPPSEEDQLAIPEAPEKPNIFGRTFAKEKFSEMNREYKQDMLKRELHMAKLQTQYREKLQERARKIEKLHKEYNDEIAMRERTIKDYYDLLIVDVTLAVKERTPKNGDIRVSADVEYFDENAVYLLVAEYSHGRADPLNFPKNGYRAYFIKQY